MIKKPRLLVGSLFFPLFVGFIGSYFTISAIPTWYESLSKPIFNPPNAIFGPVWTVLYILMGISLYLVLRKNKKKEVVLNIFVLQLSLNFLWTYIFFWLKNPLLAFIEIILLWLLIVYMIKIFFKISKDAGYLLLPYLIWTSFASLLNLSIILLN